MENNGFDNKDNFSEEEEDNNKEELNFEEINMEEMIEEMGQEMKNVFEEVNMEEMKDLEMGHDNENVSKEENRVDDSQQEETTFKSLESLREKITDLQGRVHKMKEKLDLDSVNEKLKVMQNALGTIISIVDVIMQRAIFGTVSRHTKIKKSRGKSKGKLKGKWFRKKIARKK